MTNEFKKGNNALSFFHQKPGNWNCAQAIAKAYEGFRYENEEQIESELRSKGGGRAEEGLCGSLYTSLQILGVDSPEAIEMKAEFKEKLGATTCRALKAELAVPCTDSVNTADILLQKYLAKQQERLGKQN